MAFRFYDLRGPVPENPLPLFDFLCPAGQPLSAAPRGLCESCESYFQGNSRQNCTQVNELVTTTCFSGIRLHLQDPFAVRFVPFPPTDETRIYSAWSSESMDIDFHAPYAKGADDAMSIYLSGICSAF